MNHAEAANFELKLSTRGCTCGGSIPVLETFATDGTNVRHPTWYIPGALLNRCPATATILISLAHIPEPVQFPQGSQ